jgi:hypothetical protein
MLCPAARSGRRAAADFFDVDCALTLRRRYVPLRDPDLIAAWKPGAATVIAPAQRDLGPR